MSKQAQHTPDHIHNPSSPCGCYIDHGWGDTESIGYCDLHKAAPELLAAIKQAVSDMLETGNPGFILANLRAAIATAEGRDE